MADLAGSTLLMQWRRLLLSLALLWSGWTGALSAQASVVVIVRHAEKAATGGRDPSLSAEGQARAMALAQALRDSHIDQVLVTEFRRTGETAGPFTEQHHLAPRQVDVGRLTVADHAGAVLAALDGMPGGSAALVVGHSNTVGPIIAALGGPALPDLADDEYATLFLVTRLPGQPVRLIRLTYGAVANSITR